MTPEARENLLQLFVPEDSYRSPEVPTQRLGTNATITVFAARATTDATATRAPSSWLALEKPSGDVIALARTRTMSLVGSFTPGPVGDLLGTLTPPDAYDLLRSLWSDLQTAFFGGAAFPAEAAKDVLNAYRSTIPPRLLPWVELCCADFFAWLWAQRAT